jgi:hypothetical protein
MFLPRKVYIAGYLDLISLSPLMLLLFYASNQI